MAGTVTQNRFVTKNQHFRNRAIFKFSVESTGAFHDCFGFALLRFVIGLKTSTTNFLNQAEVKPKAMVTCSHTFSYSWHQRHVFASNSDWFIELSVSVVIHQSKYFSFGFTAFN